MFSGEREGRRTHLALEKHEGSARRRYRYETRRADAKKRELQRGVVARSEGCRREYRESRLAAHRHQPSLLWAFITDGIERANEWAERDWQRYRKYVDEQLTRYVRSDDFALDAAYAHYCDELMRMKVYAEFFQKDDVFREDDQDSRENRRGEFSEFNHCTCWHCVCWGAENVYRPGPGAIAFRSIYMDLPLSPQTPI